MNVNWRRLLGEYFPDARGRLTLIMVLSALRSLVVLPVAWLIRHLFDQAIPLGRLPAMAWPAAGIVLLYLLEGGLLLWIRSLSLSETKQAIRRIRNDLIDKIYALPHRDFHARDPMQLHTAVIQDTLRTDIMINALASQVTPALLVSLGAGAVLVYLSLPLFLVAMVIFPCLWGMGRYANKHFKKKVRVYHESFSRFSGRVAALLRHRDLTRIQEMEPAETDRQQRLHHEVMTTSKAQALAGALGRIVQRTAIMFVGVLILLVGGWFVARGRMTMGDLFAFVAATSILRNSLQEVVNGVPHVIEGLESRQRLQRLFADTQSPRHRGTRKIRFTGEVVLEKVGFAYGDQPLFSQVDLELTPGSISILTGENGSGKSTLAYLIAGFFPPDSGRLLASGTPYAELDLACLRRYTGFVHQVPMVIDGTLYENIAYGHPEATREAVLEAARLATAAKWIASLPSGLDTRIAGMGAGTSAGELQKAAIARALLGGPRLIILDEPTSHLDRASAHMLMGNLKALSPRPTFLIISHDPEIVAAGDQVMELGPRGVTPRDKVSSQTTGQ